MMKIHRVVLEGDNFIVVRYYSHLVVCNEVIQSEQFGLCCRDLLCKARLILLLSLIPSEGHLSDMKHEAA